MASGCSKNLVVLMVVVLSFSINGFQNQFCLADPTDGFQQVAISSNELVLQKPYDQPTQNRYRSQDGVEKFWVYNNDKPFKPDSPTRPRTEIRIRGHDYSSGVWQFEGTAYVPKGTSGVTIMQVFGGASQATTLQLRVYNGELRYYSNRFVASNIYDRWFRVNVIHDVEQGKVTVFIDGAQKLVVDDKGRATIYFKYGVYAAPEGSSNYMESRWRGVKIFKK
ncbi:citrate-binding protein [Ziziphus jujuba]|uniref:Citrate-binding protein n=1 Tax=Ziziphus jujuba TaxID=326968 RepID=A0A6P4ADX4_ZIZJJ|nr:citrate-binding protein [Ziziphus jujuba]